MINFQVITSNHLPVFTTDMVSITIGGNVVVFQADNKGSLGNIWLDGVPVTIGNQYRISPGHELYATMSSTKQYTLTGSDIFKIILDMKVGYIDVFMASERAGCFSSEGLLGRCDDDIVNEFTASNGILLQENDVTYPLNVDNIDNIFISSWKILSSSSFSTVYDHFKPASGERGLYINDSPLSSSTVFAFTEFKFTIDLIFFMKQTENECSTLWSYHCPSGDVTSVLVCSNHISVVVVSDSERRHDINTISVSSDTWYQFTVSWNGLNTPTMNLYLIVETKGFSNSYIELDANPFCTGGNFKLGTSYGSQRYGLTGYIDDFVVWRRDLSLQEVIDNSFSFKRTSISDISAIWRFNEGIGNTAHDATGVQGAFTWGKDTWTDISWSPCYYQTSMPFASSFTTETLLDTSLCYGVTKSIAGQNDAAWYKFYQDCIADTSYTGDVNIAKEFILPIADSLNPDRRSDVYPVKDLCNVYPLYADWHGDLCDVQCIAWAGIYDSSTHACDCYDGFWGDACESTCPFAFGSSCGGGVCDKDTGSCQCITDRFSSVSRCEGCSTGWVGQNCSMTEVDVPTSLQTRFAMSYGQGHFIMFDGQTYDLNTPGEYLLFESQSQSLLVFVRMRLCSGCRTCIQQVWFSLPSDDFIVKLPLILTKNLLMEHNGDSVTILNLASYTINTETTISWIDKVTLQFSSQNTIIQVTYLENTPYLSINVKIPLADCSASMISGLLGRCDVTVNKANDFLSADGTVEDYIDVSQNFINEEFASYYSLPYSSENMFFYTYPDSIAAESPILNRSYSILINASGVSTEPIPSAVLPLNGGKGNLSLELTCKTFSGSGLILGYYKKGSDNMFSFYMLNGETMIYAHGESVQIGYNLTINTWYDFIMTFDTGSNYMEVHIFLDENLVHSYSKTFAVLDFPDEGNFMLGKWIVDPPISFGEFTGLIGVFKAWNLYFDDEILYHLRKGKITDNPALKLDYQFVEGFGYTTKDVKNGIYMTMPKDEKVVWILADKPAKASVILECSDLPLDVNNDCNEFINSASLTLACGGLGLSLQGFFIDSCEIDGSYVMALSNYISICEEIISPDPSPRADLCEDYTSEHYAKFCGHMCMQGTPTATGCLCNEGYWSENCGQECPARVGELGLPCNGNGYCDHGLGICLCNLGFDPSGNCSVCLPVFSGDDCDKAVVIFPGDETTTLSTTVGIGSTRGLSNVTSGTVPGSSSNTSSSGSPTHGTASTLSTAQSPSTVSPSVPNDNVDSVCIVFGSVTVIGFSGNLYSITTPYEYYLVNGANDIPEVIARLIQCGQNLCIGSLKVSYNDEIVVDASNPESSNVLLNGDSDLSIATYFFIRRSVYLLDVELKPSNSRKFYLRVIFNEKYITSVALKTNCKSCIQESICLPSTGMLTRYVSLDFDITSENVIVPSNLQTLPDHILEPTTPFGYCLVFEEETDMTEDPFADSLAGIDELSSVTGNGDTGSVIYSPILTDVFDESHSLNFTLSIKPVQGSSGGIIQYAGNCSFAVFLDNQEVKVQTCEHIVDTGIIVAADEWTILELVTDPLTNFATLKALSPNLTAEEREIFSHTFDLPSSLFEGNGRLIVGRPMYSFNFSIDSPTSASFLGEIDDIIIHKEGHVVFDVNFNDIDADKSIILNSAGTGDLRVYHPFNDGTVTHNVSTKPSTPLDIDTHGVFTEYDILVHARDTCSSLFSRPELAACESLGQNIKEMYEIFCVDEYARKSDQGSEAILLSYTSSCDLLLVDSYDISTINTGNPTSQLCDLNPRLGFVGSGCDIRCDFPDIQGDLLTCSCAEGYWDAFCDKVCPGNVDNPCNRNGQCTSTTGVCECNINYSGTECSHCETNYYGNDCQAVLDQQVTAVNGMYTGYIGSNSFIKTLDGVRTEINNHDKPFTVYTDDLIRVEAQKMPTRNYDSAVTSVAFKVGPEIITVSPIGGGLATVNGAPIDLGSVDLPSGFKIQRINSKEITVTGPDNFEMRLFVGSGENLDLNLKVSEARCSTSQGVLGRCTTEDASGCSDIVCAINSLGLYSALKTQSISLSDQDQYFYNKSLEYAETLFAEIGQTKQTGGFAVKLDQSSISLPEFDEDFLQASSTEKSVEMRLKFDTDATGTVFSIANEEITMGLVIIDGKLFVQVGDDTFDTKTKVPVGEWMNLGLTFNDTNGELTFFEIHETGKNYMVFNISDLLHLYGPAIAIGSSLEIGKWQNLVTRLKSHPPASDFNPVISVDRVLFYDRIVPMPELEYNFIKNANNYTYMANEDQKPSLGFNFDEGSGTVMTDFVHGTESYLSFAGYYEWVLSNAPIFDKAVIPRDRLGFRVGDVLPELKIICDSILASFQSSCTVQTITTSFYMQCMSTIRTLEDTNLVIDALLQAGTDCMYLMGISTRPSDISCNFFTSGLYPAVDGQNCDVICLFGTVINEICVCDDGYFGSSCSVECPGGHSLPCNGHGTCDTTDGTCVCDSNWAGDPHCTTCSEYYYEEDCSVYVLDPTMNYTTATTSPTTLMTSIDTNSNTTISGSTGVTSSGQVSQSSPGGTTVSPLTDLTTVDHSTTTSDSGSKNKRNRKLVCKAQGKGYFRTVWKTRHQLPVVMDKTVLIETHNLRILVSKPLILTFPKQALVFMCLQ